MRVCWRRRSRSARTTSLSRARRWALRQQPDGGEADYARRRARRYVRFWDADGMVHLKGEFDPLTGRRIQHRLEADARRALRADRQQASATGTARTFAQCMADTLQDITLNPLTLRAHQQHRQQQWWRRLTAQPARRQQRFRRRRTAPPRGLKPSTATPAAQPHATAISPTPSRTQRPAAVPAQQRTLGSRTTQPTATPTQQPTTNTRNSTPNAHNRASDAGRAYAKSKPSNDNRTASAANREPANSCGGLGPVSGCGCENSAPSASAAGGRGVKGVGLGGCGPGKPSARAQVAVVAHLDAAQSKLVGELAGGEPLPASVLEELLCNSEAFGVLFSDKGKPLWQGNKKRFADDNLMRALIARDGACVGCGAHYAICEGHHIEPVSQGGATDIDNMVLACGRCHHRVHHDGWQVVVYADRYSIEPPPTRAPRASTRP